MKKIILAIFITAFLIIGKTTNKTQAQETPSEQTLMCIGRDLAKFMNGVITNSGNLEHVKLLSPAFNMTHAQSPQIFTYMQEYGANFNALSGFAGNVYSHPTGSTDTAYSFYDNNGWKGFFNSYGKSVIFTEFGDFRLGDTEMNNRSGLISEMAGEFTQVHNDSNIIASLYFSVLPGSNPGFDWNNMSNAELSQAVASNPSAGGANSAAIIDGSGGFPKKVAGTGVGLGWTLEIVISPQDIQSTIKAVTATQAEGLIPIVRFCTEDNCGFGGDPATLANFIRQLDSAVTGEVWVIAGPNEPINELWATPACQGRDWGVEWYSCSDTARDLEDTSKTGPEFHSLRPYPASNSCEAPDLNLIPICGNQMIINEDIEVTPSSATNCTGSPGNLTCHFEIQAQTQITIKTDDLELPILGNTELVPNGVSGTNNLNFPSRMNEYVSWYLNGVVQRAEERFFTTPDDIYELINFSGPIRKLLPQKLQTEIREDQQEESTKTVHNQIVSCGDGDNPYPCYENSDERYRRLEDPRPSEADFSYIPYSSTEDADGFIYGPDEASWKPKSETIKDVLISDLSINYSEDYDNKEKLYFAHVNEGVKTSDILQSTFAPSSKTYKPDSNSGTPINPVELGFELADAFKGLFSSDSSTNNIDYTGIPDDVVLAQREENGCVIIGAVTGSGDDLYGELDASTRENKRNLTSGDYKDFIEDEGSVTGVVSYTATFDHTFTEEELENAKYTAKVIIKVPVALEMPGADDLWSRLVAGNMSIFRRIFPKVGSSATPEIVDLPGESYANYQSDNISLSSGTLTNENTMAGNINSPSSGSSASIYFPHIGGVQKYFLEDIQTMLRPKDVSKESQTGASPASSNCQELTYSINYINTSVQPNTADKIITDLRTKNPGGFGASTLDRTAENININYNTIVSNAISAGYNPAFVLAIWIEESAASALDAYDFGCGGAPKNNFDSQLNCFLSLYDDWSLSGKYDSMMGSCREGENPNFKEFMFFFSEGICTTAEAQDFKYCGNAAFPRRLKAFYDLVTG